MKKTSNSFVPYFSNMRAWGSTETTLNRVYAKYADFMSSCGDVLDLGCGRGYFMDLLVERGVQAIGVDSDEDVVSFCRERKLQVVQMDAVDYLQSLDSSVGGIFCGCMFEHLDAQQAETLLRHCSRLIRPKGRLVIVTDNPAVWRTHADWFWRDLTHQRLYPLSLLKALFEHYGFTVVKSGPDYDLISLPDTWRSRLVRKIRRVILGKEFYDAIYEPGAVYIMGERL